MHNKINILNNKERFFNNIFNRIRIADSAEFVLKSEFQEYYKRVFNGHSETCAKIKLEYDFNTGEFLNSDVIDDSSCDAGYLPNVYPNIEPKDLYIKDREDFDIYYFKLLAEKGAYFLTRIENNVTIFND